jgi:hypothetical protein
MFFRKRLICLITHGLILFVSLSASASTVSRHDQVAYRPPHVVPVPTELIGYHLVAPVILSTPLNSKTVTIGQTIQGKLKNDFVLAGRTYACKNAIVKGRVISYIAPRTMSQALGSDRRFNSRAALALQFDEIIDTSGAHIPVVGFPSRQTVSIPGRNAPSREVKVDAQGRIVKAETVLTDTQRRVYNSARAATLVPIPGSMLVTAMGTPVVMGAAGAADPSFAYNKPVDEKVEHRRWKGMVYAFLTNLPGAFLVQAVVEKGDEIILNAGDELAVDMQLKQQPPPFALADVRGAVLTKAHQTAPLPGCLPDDYTDELVAQTAKYDDSVQISGKSVPEAKGIIQPVNGGQRLLPAGGWLTRR